MDSQKQKRANTIEWLVVDIRPSPVGWASSQLSGMVLRHATVRSVQYCT